MSTRLERPLNFVTCLLCGDNAKVSITGKDESVRFWQADPQGRLGSENCDRPVSGVEQTLAKSLLKECVPYSRHCQWKSYQAGIGTEQSASTGCFQEAKLNWPLFGNESWKTTVASVPLCGVPHNAFLNVHKKRETLWNKMSKHSITDSTKGTTT